MDLIPRHLLPEVLQDTPPRAVAIFGPRRIGKTTMLELLGNPVKTRWFIGDDIRNTPRALQFSSQADIRNFLMQNETIVIDEAHKVEDIGNIVKMLVDVNEHVEKPAKIFLTSSSPFYLVSVKETALGRVTSRQMWPFSASELADYTSWGYVTDNLPQYMIYGLMPDVYRDLSRARAYLDDYCSGQLLRDVLEGDDVRLQGKFRGLVELLARYVGSEVSYEGLARELGLHRLTVEDYVNKLEKASIIKVCSSFSRNMANELKKGKKIYFFDNGVRNALIRDFSPLAGRDDAGALWENFFFMERLKLHDTRRDFIQIYFWRSTGNDPKEIDFVEVLDRKIHAYECKLSPNVTKCRGKDAFLKKYPESVVEIVHPQDIQRIFSDPERASGF